MGDVTLDTSDVDRWVGVPLGGGYLKDPVQVNDIRRWAQGMQNPNPVYYDDRFAAEGRFGRIVAPQSFAVATDVGHGATPAIQGTIPGSHMIFGGDEWWFFGPRIEPGDRIKGERMLFDYRVTETKFAGPTMFSRGDTTYINQRGEMVAKQRSTSIRYLAEEARKRAQFDEKDDPEWSDDALADIEEQKFAYYSTFRGHDKVLWKDVNEGNRLPTRPIGPHTLMSFTTEWRAFNMNIWGAADYWGVSTTDAAGWLPEMSRDPRQAAIDPTKADGLYQGPSRGHVQPRYARLIGMPRGYGYGATMGAWILDYLTNWSGEWGEIVHSNAQYRNPAFTGDATFLNGTVTGKDIDPSTGHHLAFVEYTMTNQRDAVMAKGTAEISLPNE
ncbi:MAG TPA: MaoC family dehydratase N-terminal domain-containing protein [Acidimicrobiales bacterium]|jgi:acyl dehydratase